LNKINITFVTHNVHLTGAPKLLLNLIRVLNKINQYNISVIIKEDKGELTDDFKILVNTLVWKQKLRNNKNLILSKIQEKYIQHRAEKKIQTLINESNIIISNTITNGDFFNKFNFDKVKKCICYVHELEIATEFFTNSNDLKVILETINHFIVPSNAVANHLIKNLSVSQNKISSLNYFIPNPNIKFAKVSENEIFYVGIIGTLDWRKGADILPVFIKLFYDRDPTIKIKFIWRGIDKNNIHFKRIKYELNKINYSDKVIFEQAEKNTESFFKRIKLHISLSKEDPYPLVVLEAASYKIPSLCFDGSGGAQEFISNDAGAVVPYLDLKLLSERIIYFFENQDTLKLFGKNAFNKFMNLHHKEDLILKQFQNIINSSLTK
jgi:glycosyltransferase involved in cell wall biosynthesis